MIVARCGLWSVESTILATENWSALDAESGNIQCQSVTSVITAPIGHRITNSDAQNKELEVLFSPVVFVTWAFVRSHVVTDVGDNYISKPGVVTSKQYISLFPSGSDIDYIRK